MDEGPSEADIERFGDATQKCPECGTQLYDDVDVCWKCGHALASRREHTPMSMIVVLAVVGLLLIAILFWRAI